MSRVTIWRMIKSFRDRETERVLQRRLSRRLPGEIQRVAYRKLVQLDAATRLETLRVPPGNRLEALSGSRRGQHSIRINDQWRICFVWHDGDAYEVEIADYH
jgi:proteic killer suppression protein